jgi:hypothetical protein
MAATLETQSCGSFLDHQTVRHTAFPFYLAVFRVEDSEDRRRCGF